MEREAWALYDTRTGKRLAMSSYLSKEQAEWDIDNMKKRATKVRLRTEHLLPHLGIVQLTAETWGSTPGDIIAQVIENQE